MRAGAGASLSRKKNSRSAFKSRTGPRGAGGRGSGPAARLRGGGFRAVAPAARPLCRPCPHSLSGSRRCPHFIAPGRPAPGLRTKGATACGRWWGLPSGPLGRPSRPQRPAGRSPARPGRRWRRPPRPPAAVGVMWRLVAACGGSGQASRLRCSGAPLRAARPSPCGARSARPCPAPPPRRSRRRCSGAARPTQSGGCGAVRPSGPALRAGVAAAAPRGVPAAKPGPRASGRSSAAPLRGLALAAPLAPAGPQFRRRA